MSKFEGMTNGPLTIARSDESGELWLTFVGKSILRDPSELLQPILLQVLGEAEDQSHRLVLDFRPLTYMNSSTFTPVVKTLEKARLGESSITIYYSKTAKWQAVSFTALSIFATADGRVAVVGTE